MFKNLISYKVTTIVFGSLFIMTFLASTFDVFVGRFLLSDESRASYALGIDIAEGFVRQGIDINSSAFKMGIEHGLSSKSKITAQQKEQFLEFAKQQAKSESQKIAQERAEYLKNEMEKLKRQSLSPSRQAQPPINQNSHFGPEKGLVGPQKKSNDLPTSAPVDLKK